MWCGGLCHLCMYGQGHWTEQGALRGGGLHPDYKIDESMCQARRKATGRIQNALTR